MARSRMSLASSVSMDATIWPSSVTVSGWGLTDRREATLGDGSLRRANHWPRVADSLPERRVCGGMLKARETLISRAFRSGDRI